MDRTLLQETRVPGGEEPPVLEHSSTTNNDRVTAEDNAPQPQPQYRDIAIESPQPPLRLRLDPPITYDGETFSELIFDFDSMTGKDFQRAEREFTRTYKADRNEMPMPELKHQYHAIIAAHLANVPVGLIQKLPRRYYTPLRTEVLKACGSSPEEEA